MRLSRYKEQNQLQSINPTYIFNKASLILQILPSKTQINERQLFGY